MSATTAICDLQEFLLLIAANQENFTLPSVQKAARLGQALPVSGPLTGEGS
jgi:hypothetical protein